MTRDGTSVDAAVEDVQLVVLGGGPAGLAAAVKGKDARQAVVLLELGDRASARKRHDAHHLVAGVGGAGLYSDGKFSFFPSASKLWSLDNRADLITAYAWLLDLLAGTIDVPAYPSPEAIKALATAEFDGLKSYPARYLDFDARSTILERLTSVLGSRIKPNAEVFAVEPETDGRVLVRYRLADQVIRTLRTEALILASGRLGGLGLSHLMPWLPTTFRRYEFGIRLSSPADRFFLQHHADLDPKFILHDGERPEVEWRTFCTCRNGEVVKTNFDGFLTYSGRADVAPTDYSNVGFNVRIKSDPDPQSPVGREIRAVLSGEVEPFSMSLAEYIRGTAGYGPGLDALLRHGLTLLSHVDVESTVVWGPCVEGVGQYPVLGESLRVPDTHIWVAGDQTGVFRGLTAAFVSGHYAAAQAGRYISGVRQLSLSGRSK